MKIKAGKIASIEVFLDANAYMSTFEEET